MGYVINAHCSTCHYCFNVCPVKAIRFVGVEYAIDAEKCIGCGKCAEVCPAGVIIDGDKKQAAAVHASESMYADAVILGAGGAGLVAAVRYKQLTGKNVIVLEKSRMVGGNTNLGHAFVVRYSKLHEKVGMPDLRAEAVESIWNGSDGQEMSKELLARAVYGLSDMFDWLCKFGGVEDHFRLVDLRERKMEGGPFVACPGFFDFPKRTQNTDSSDHSMGPGWMGTFVVGKMMEQCRQMGISVLTEHRAAHLVIDEDGAFTAVEAESPGGALTVNAKCCLIATGGFSNNGRIMRQVRPSFCEGFPVHTFSVASNTGDAIDMVSEIGGRLDFEHIKVPMFGPVHHPFSYGVVSLVENPRIVMVNLNGRRFINEGAPPNPAMPQLGVLENQPQKMAYAIFDSKTASVMGEELLDRTKSNPELHHGMLAWKEQLEYECTLDVAAKKADSLEELAELTGISKRGLLDEIEKYNMFCQQGSDDDFDKAPDKLSTVEDGPFYAVLMIRFNEGAEGGIDNDEQLRVLRADGAAFSGLYIAGDSCRGVLKKDDIGGKFGEMPWAMASGFIAAEEMAKL